MAKAGLSVMERQNALREQAEKKRREQPSKKKQEGEKIEKTEENKKLNLGCDDHEDLKNIQDNEFAELFASENFERCIEAVLKLSEESSMRKVNALKASKAFNTWRKSADAQDGCDIEEF